MKAIEEAQAACTRPEYRPEALYSLLARFSHLGVGEDASSMSEDDLKWLYRFLQRKAHAGEQ